VKRPDLCEPRTTPVGQQTDYPTSIGNVLKEMRDRKADLLRVLERPEVPLHNNGTESIIRGYVTTRKISGSTRSAAGRCYRDTLASLQKTCRKLGLSFWAYLQDRLRGLGTIARLADLKKHRLLRSYRRTTRSVAKALAGESCPVI
jgi:hypothetical protein